MAKIIFRCNASRKEGLGHFFRCKTLALEFLKRKHNIFFLIPKVDKELKTVLEKNIEKAKIEFVEIKSKEQDVQTIANCYQEKKSDLLILDHYNLDNDYQKNLQKNNIVWLQFDYQANLNFYCDYLLNYRPLVDESFYAGKVKNKDCKLLLGSQYAIIKYRLRKIKKPIKQYTKVQNIMINFGGGDDRGAIMKICQFLEKIKCDSWINIVTTELNPNLKTIQEYIQKSNLNIKLYIRPKNFEVLFVKSDIAILAGGVTSYEAAYLGIPTILVQIASNQKLNAQIWEKIGCVKTLDIKNLYFEQFRKVFGELFHKPEIRKEMSQKGRSSIDGLGVERIIKTINL